MTIFLAAILASVLNLTSCSERDYAGKIETITVGTLPYEGSALIYIAEARGFFEANGLKVILRDYETGLATTDALTKGEVDVAACAEFVIVGKAFRKEKIFSIATIARNVNELIIGRTDRGIKAPADLKGKKVGVPRKTVAEFYLGRFFELNGMSMKEVTLVDLLPSRMEEALVRHDVDTVIVWQPWASRIETRLGNNKVVWPAQSGQLMYWNIVTRDPWVADHPELIKRLLRSLIRAEEYTARHPGEAEAIVRAKLEYDHAYMAKVWAEQQSSITLDQALITAMEDEARWMIKNNLTTEKTLPNFGNHIHEDLLKAVKPEGVSIIR
jgi:NitT/TauT family transport system substrate-binding protein